MLRRTELSIGYSGLLYGEANRCRHILLPITENVFGGNGIQCIKATGSAALDNSNEQGCFAIA